MTKPKPAHLKVVRLPSATSKKAKRSRKFLDVDRRFCTFIAAGRSEEEAYTAAGYHHLKNPPPLEEVWQLPKLRTLVNQLKAIRGIALDVTTDSLIAEIEEVRLTAKALAQPKIQLQATMAKAELLGMLVDHKEVQHTHVSLPSPTPTRRIEMTAEEWTEQWAPREITQQ